MATYLTSDTHFQHVNLLTLGAGRPFNTIEEHDAALIANWNATVSPRDEVIHLGDFAMGNRDNVPAIRARLNGKIHLVYGNHDNIKKYTKQGVFDSLTKRMEFEYNGLKLVLKHMPNNQEFWDKTSHEVMESEPGFDLMLHGHVHDRWKRKGPFINVGVDVWGYRPVSLQEVVSCQED